MTELSNTKKGELLEFPIWRTLESFMRSNLEEVGWGPREPYVRATLEGDGYIMKWNYPNTSDEGSSRSDFTVLKEVTPILDSGRCSGDRERYGPKKRISLLNIEAHNLNIDFRVSYSWHDNNTLSRFRDQPAIQNYLIASCYNPTKTDYDEIYESFQTSKIILIPLGRQILSEKDMLAPIQIERKLSPYLNQIFSQTSTHEITLPS